MRPGEAAPARICTKSTRGDHLRSTAASGSGTSGSGAAACGFDRTRTSTTAPATLFAALARDGRASYPELHRATGLSESAVKRRLSESAVKRRLEQLRGSGVLYTDVQLDTAWIGHDTRALSWTTAAPSALHSVGTALAAHRQTAYVAATTGSSNLVAVVICRDAAGMYRYLSEQVGALEGVRHVETVPSLRLVKQITTEGIH